MQIYAQNDKGQLICASQAQAHTRYRCRTCQGELGVRAGLWRARHFYHLHTGQTCPSKHKTLQHIHAQEALRCLLAPDPVLLEAPFPSIQRIADVVWPTGRLIFEVQCSPISPQELQARSRAYVQLGYTVVWVLHDARYNRTRLTAAEQALGNAPHFFTNINSQGAGLFYTQSADIVNNRRLRRGPRIPLDIKHLFHTPPPFSTTSNAPSRSFTLLYPLLRILQGLWLGIVEKSCQ